MIVPLTPEQGWADLIRKLPQWLPSDAPILLVAPHPDDEILGAGGLLTTQSSLGAQIRVLAVTDGEHAYPENPDSVGLGILRCTEQTQALRRVGVRAENITRLRLPDSDVSNHVPQLLEQMALLVTKDTHIIAPWKGDFHPDHEACGMAAEKVAEKTGAQLSAYMFWTWHRGTPSLLRDLPLRSFHLSAHSLRAKTEALLCHRSQLFRAQGEPILPQSLLGPAQRPFEVFIVS